MLSGKNKLFCAALLALLTLPFTALPFDVDAQKSSSAEYGYFERGDKLSQLFQPAEGEDGIAGLSVAIADSLDAGTNLDYDISFWSDLAVDVPGVGASEQYANGQLMMYIKVLAMPEDDKRTRLTAKYGALTLLTEQDGQRVELQAVGRDTDHDTTTSSEMLLNGESPAGNELAGLPDVGSIASRMSDPVAFAVLEDGNRLAHAAHGVSFNEQSAMHDPGRLLDPMLFLRLLFAGYGAKAENEHHISEELVFDSVALSMDSLQAKPMPYRVSMKLRDVYGDNEAREARAAEYDVTITAISNLPQPLDPLNAEESLSYLPPQELTGRITFDIERGIVTSAKLQGSYTPREERDENELKVTGDFGFSVELRVPQDAE